MCGACAYERLVRDPPLDIMGLQSVWGSDAEKHRPLSLGVDLAGQLEAGSEGLAIESIIEYAAA